jgi:hypothetical protein
MARSELTRQEILRATQEYDRLGREAFLDKYGFGQARSYLLVHNGKTYDSKAIVGAAHGLLTGAVRRSPPRTSAAAPRRSAACSPTSASKSERTRAPP